MLHADVDRRRLGRQHLIVGGDEVGARRRADHILVLQNVARAPELDERVLDRDLQLVGGAQVKIGDGELNLRGERRIGEIGA